MVRNGAFAVAAVVLLLGGLLLLVPQHAGAAQVHFGSAGVAQPTLFDDQPGTAADVYAFEALAQVHVPAGERIALDFARVIVSPPSATLSPGGVLSPAAYTADSDSGSAPRAEVVAVLGTAPGFGPRTGYRFEVQASGGGYSFANPSTIDYGYGYGYGHDTKDTKVIVKVRVIGCVGPAGGAAPIPFGSPNPTLVVKVQVFLGGSDTTLLPSFPATQTLFDPNFVPPGTPNGAPFLAPGAVTESGGIAGVPFTLGDTDGDGTPFEPTPAGVTLPETPFPAGLGGGTGVSFRLSTVTDLPAGTQVLFQFQDQGVSQSSDNPPFGINPSVLAGATGGRLIANYFQVSLSIPGEGIVPATGRITMEINLAIDDDYFRSTPRLSTGGFRLRAFQDDGSLEPVQPTRVGGTSLVAGRQQYGFRIDAFSAFVGFSVLAGGGGGSNPGVTPPTTVAPPTSTPPIVVPPVDPGTGVVPPGPELGGDTDGDGIPDSVETLVGSDPANRASGPDYDRTATLVVQRTAAGNLLQWQAAPHARGYQVWASNSPWVLLATIDNAATTSYLDASGKEATKYKVTYFVGDSTSQGKLDADPGEQADVSAISGWKEADSRSPEASTTDPAGFPRGLAIAFLVAAILGVIVLVIAARRRKQA